MTVQRIWLVGASEGIGAELARILARQGARLALSARSESMLQTLAAELGADRHLVLPLDVTNMNSIRAAWLDLKTAWDGVDTLIYNAGVYEPMGAKALDIAQAERMVEVNFGGALRVLSLILDGFVQRNAGHIVLVGSLAGYRGLPKAIGYGASKAALIHLAENLRVDLADTNIKVQLVSPGFVRTRLTNKNDFAMPFLLEPDDAARRIVAGMATNRFEIHFPWPLALAFKALRLLPAWLYFRVAHKFL